MENKKKHTGLKIFLGIVIFLVVFAVGVSFALSAIKKKVTNYVKDTKNVEQLVENLIGENLDEEFTSISDSLSENYNNDGVSKEDSSSSAASANDDLVVEGTPVNSLAIDEDIENFNIYIESTVEVSGARISLESKGTVDQNNQVEYLSSTVADLSISDSDSSYGELGSLASLIGSMGITIDMYIDMENGISYTKIPSTAAFLGVENAGEWSKSQEAAGKMDMGAILKTLSESDRTEQIGENKYRTYISGKEASDSIPSSIGDSQVDPNLFKEDVPVIFTVEEGRITTIRFDFSGMGAALDMNFYVVITNYNEAGEVVIPSEIK